MPRLKVCGIRDAAFAVEAARRGVDFLGLIFAKASPRRVTVEEARRIVAAVSEWHASQPASAAGGPPPAPRFVGVFVEQTVDEILAISGTVPIDVVQLHRVCEADEVPRLKAAGYEVWQLGTVPEELGTVPGDAVLLDGRDGARSGGTGRRADWSLVEPLRRAGLRVVLAGGISSANIAAAAATGADVIDVNSSLETSPGVKSVALLDELLKSLSFTNAVIDTTN